MKIDFELLPLKSWTEIQLTEFMTEDIAQLLQVDNFYNLVGKIFTKYTTNTRECHCNIIKMICDHGIDVNTSTHVYLQIALIIDTKHAGFFDTDDIGYYLNLINSK